MPRGRRKPGAEEEALLGDQPESWTTVQLRNRGQPQEHTRIPLGCVRQSPYQFNNNSSISNHNHYYHGSSFPSTLARFDFISHEVQPEDTLAGIALRYNCKLALLKQANNIASELQLAALPTVRVPVPRNGVQVVTGQLVDISGKVEIQREAPPREELCPQRFMANLDEKLRVLQEQAPPPASPPPIGPINGLHKPRAIFSSTCIMISCLFGVCVGLPAFYTLYILIFHGDVFKLMGS